MSLVDKIKSRMASNKKKASSRVADVRKRASAAEEERKKKASQTSGSTAPRKEYTPEQIKTGVSNLFNNYRQKRLEQDPESSYLKGWDTRAKHENAVNNANSLGSARDTRYSLTGGKDLRTSGELNRRSQATLDAANAAKYFSSGEADFGFDWLKDWMDRNWQQKSEDAYSQSSYENAMNWARSGDKFLMNQQRNYLERLKKEGYAGKNIWGKEKYNNQDEIDAAQAALDEMERLRRGYGYEEAYHGFLQDAMPKAQGTATTYAEMLDAQREYSFDDYYADLETLYNYAEAEKRGDFLPNADDYNEARARVNNYARGADAAQQARASVADPGYDFLTEYAQIYEDRTGMIDQRIAKKSSVYGEDDTSAFNAADLMQYLNDNDLYAKYQEESQSYDAQQADKIMANWGDVENKDYGPDAVYQQKPVYGAGEYDPVSGMTFEDTTPDWMAAINDLVYAGELGPEAFAAKKNEIENDPNMHTAQQYTNIGLQHMSPAQRKQFYELFNIPGNEENALQFIEDISGQLNKIRSEEKVAETQAAAADGTLNAVTASIGSVGNQLLSNLSAPFAMAHDALGIGAPTQAYDPVYDAGLQAQAARTGVLSQIDSGLGRILYQGGMSFADSIASALTFGKAAGALSSAIGAGAATAQTIANNVTTIAMSAGSAIGKYQEMLADGADRADAMIDAGIDGAIEFATEKFSIDNLFGDNVNPIKSALQQVFVEPSEETVGYALRLLYDKVKYGENSELAQLEREYTLQFGSKEEAEKAVRSQVAAELLETILTSVVSGGVGGAVVNTPIAINDYKTGSKLQGSDEALYNIASGITDLPPEVQKIVQGMKPSQAGEDARAELAAGKNAKAQENAAQLKDAQIAEDLSSEDARAELTEGKNAQAQENAFAEERNSKRAKAEQAAGKVKEAKGKAQKITNAQRGMVYRATMQRLDGQAQDAMRDRISYDVAAELKKLGVDKANVKDLAKSILRIQDGSFTEEDLGLVQGTEAARKVLSSWTAKMVTENKAVDRVGELAGLLTKGSKSTVSEMADPVKAEPEALEIENDFDAEVAAVQEHEILVSEGETSTLDGEEIEILGVEAAGASETGAPAKVRIRTTEGVEKTVEAKEIAYSETDTAKYELATISAKYGRNADQMYSAYQPGQNVAKFATEFNKVVQYGSDGRNLANLKANLKKNNVLRVLTEEQIDKAYEMGRGMRAARNKAQQAARSAKGATVPVGNVDRSAIEGVKLKPHQEKNAAMWESLAPLLGVNVRLVRSQVNAAGKYADKNGSWNANTRTVTVDVNSGKLEKGDLRNIMADTGGHELTHYIRQLADSNLWDEYQDFVMSHLDTKLDLEYEIEARMSADETLSRDDAIEEIIAQASVKALGKITEQDLAELAGSNPTLFGKIKEFLSKWIKDLKEKIQEAFGSTVGESNRIAQAMDDVLDEMAAKWNAMLVNAGKKANETNAQKKAPAPVQAKQVQQEAGKQFIPYAHIDERSLDSVKDMHTELFCSQVDAAQYAYSTAAKILMGDLSQSIAGQKFFAWDDQGDMTVTGQKRVTSEMLAHMKDSMGWTWDDIRKTLQNFIDMGDADKGFPLVKNTIRNRRMEVYLHEILTEGYTTIDGMKLAPWSEYAEMIAEYQGSQGAGLNARIDEDAIPFEEYIAPDEDVKYSEREDFGEQIDRLRAGTFPRHSHLYVMDTPDVLIKAGLPKLPILMTQNHARSVMKESGKDNANYHGLTRAGMKNLPQAIANSSVVIRAAGFDNRVIAFTDMRNAKGEVVIAPVEIQGKGYWQNAEIDANILATAYGKKNIKDMIVHAIMNNDVLYVDKKRSYALEKIVGVQFSKNFLGGASERIVAQNDGDVKYQERDPDQISDRALLATALQSVTQNADEWDNLRRYQNKIAALNEKQRMLEQTNARIAELRAQDAKANRDEIIRLENAASIYTKQINRADGELLKYEAMKPIKKLADREREAYRQRLKAQTDERIRKYKERMKMDAQDKIREVREREAEKRRKLREQGDDRLRKAVKEQREIGQRKVDSMKESDMKAKYKGRLLKDVGTMREWLTKPTNKGHVPQFLRAPLADFLESLDFSSDRSLKGGDATQADAKMLEKMDALRRALANTRSQQTDIESGEAAFRGYMDLPAGFADKFDEAVASIKATLAKGGTDAPINRMTGEQLKDLSDMIRTINTAVRQMNSFLANTRFQQVSEAARNTMGVLGKLGEKISKSEMLDKVGSFMDWTNTTPYYAFKRFGEGGKAIFQALMDGWDKLAFNSKELIDYANSVYDTKQVRAWSKELHMIDLNGKQLQMTTAQIMSLYCLNKREQARGHLLGGGIRIADIQMKGKVISQADNHTLTEDEIQKITRLLTGEQIAVADKLQHFMNTRCTEWGNEVSMKRFGYEAFGDEANYFPIESDSNNLKGLDAQAQENSLFRLLNLSATKSTVKNANNALVVRDIFDVFSAHGADMAKYNALALPILDALKWYNYVDKTNYDDGSLETQSIQKALEKAYGKDAQKYIRNFLKDLNGVREGGRSDGMFNKMLSNYKIAAVANNLRVGMLQITSMPRAAYAIDPKYLAIGAAKNVVFSNSKQVADKVGISLWKSMGFYDTNISRNVRELVKHDQDLGGKIKEKSMILAETGDAWTMGVLYGAVQAEMADKHPGVKKGSEAYDRMVNERMREIVYQTQVVDSTMTRSDIMRDTGAKSSLATAFMSEPTLTMNMLADSIFEQRMKARETGKKMIAPSRKMVKAFAVNALVLTFSAVMEAAFTAWRDDDEYETLAEKFDEAFLDTLLENMNLLNNIPFVKDIVSAIQGNSADRMDSAWAYNLWQGVEEIYKYLTGKSTNPAYNGIYKTLNGLSQMSGYAVGGLARELVSAYNNVIAARMGYTKIQTYADSASDAAKAVLNAYAVGDDAMAARYLDIAAKHGIEGEKLENAMKNATGDAYIEGTIDAETAKQAMETYGGKTTAEADEQLMKWDYEAETGHKYSSMKDDYIAGAVDRAKVLEYYDEDKISQWDYEKETGGAYSDMREEYISGRMNASQAMQNMMTYGGKTQEKAEEQIDRWDYYQVTGDSDGYTKYWRMYYAFDNGGDFRKYAKQWIDAGVKKSYIASSIAGRYKEEYLAIKGTPAGDRMLEHLLDLYEAIGYNRAYERKYINTKWTSD